MVLSLRVMALWGKAVSGTDGVGSRMGSSRGVFLGIASKCNRFGGVAVGSLDRTGSNALCCDTQRVSHIAQRYFTGAPAIDYRLEDGRQEDRKGRKGASGLPPDCGLLFGVFLQFPVKCGSIDAQRPSCAGDIVVRGFKGVENRVAFNLVKWADNGGVCPGLCGGLWGPL